MADKIRVVTGSLLLGLILFGVSGCIVEPHEGYWDHDHNRYYHEHSWHPCDEGHCR